MMTQCLMIDIHCDHMLVTGTVMCMVRVEQGVNRQMKVSLLRSLWISLNPSDTNYVSDIAITIVRIKLVT